ncbi:MAG: hypothetical protein J7L79_04565 [Thaumarchaeota archaeon]|nr:hypothetical protein [Nitrososphaerota archaeon]
MALHGQDRAFDVAVDGDGSIYVVGHSLDVDQGEYYGFIAKLDADGNMIWGKTWKIDALDTEDRAVAVDRDGSIYISPDRLNRLPTSSSQNSAKEVFSGGRRLGMVAVMIKHT